MEESWKVIPDYEGYYVSDFGRAKIIKNGIEKILSLREDTKGYYSIRPSKNNIGNNQMIHRVIATLFLENPETKPCVDHIDGNIKNNNITNLRWATRSENLLNQKLHSNNTSGFRGITYRKNRDTYVVHISSLDNPRKYVGSYKTKEDAVIARDAYLEVNNLSYR